MKIICFFHNKGGVGQTSLVYHLAWKMSEIGYRVMAADLDPQANLSAMFFEEAELLGAFDAGDPARTIYHAVKPLAGGGDIAPLEPATFGDRLALLPGDIRLSVFEDSLARDWTECLGQEIRPFHGISALHRVLRHGAAAMKADLVLVDVGPNLGAINRAALLAADHVIFPMGADLSSFYGLRHLGPRVAEWRDEWSERRKHFEARHASHDLDLPRGDMNPAGYVVTQHSQTTGSPGKVHRSWLERIPEVYLREVCRDAVTPVPRPEQDRNCLARLKYYPSLMSMAREARKPAFHLTPADGAMGSHVYAARDCGEDFRKLAEVIAERCHIQRSDDA